MKYAIKITNCSIGNGDIQHKTFMDTRYKDISGKDSKTSESTQIPRKMDTSLHESYGFANGFTSKLQRKSSLIEHA